MQEKNRKHVVIFIPGMLSPDSSMQKLISFIGLQEMPLTTASVSLKRSMSHLSSLIEKVERKIAFIQKNNPNVKHVILFGHSHGGRVAAHTLSKILSQKNDSHITYSLITTGTPLGLKPKRLATYKKVFFGLLSSAFYAWKPIDFSFLKHKKFKHFEAWYSPEDLLVEPSCVTDFDYAEKICFEGLSHADFLDSDKIGSVLLKSIKSSLKHN